MFCNKRWWLHMVHILNAIKLCTVKQLTLYEYHLNKISLKYKFKESFTIPCLSSPFSSSQRVALWELAEEAEEGKEAAVVAVL